MVKESIIEDLRNGGPISGERFWQTSARRIGRRPTYEDPNQLVAEVCEYFNWLEDNPLQEGKLVSFQGETKLEELPKLRAPTLQSLCCYLGINRTMWGAWRRSDDCPHLKEVITWAEDLMYAIKFEGASAGLLNPNIIARDLGLAEKTELTSPDGSMSPNRELTKEELEKEMERRGLPIPDLR